LKALFRSGPVQAALGFLLGLYMRVVLATVRWRHENAGVVEPVLAGGGGAIALFWHGRIPLCLGAAPQWWRKPLRGLVSPSADGEFLARALAMAGFPAIRTSSAKPGDSAKARAAVAAVREATTWVRGGGALGITPDGPRGPHELMQPGALHIARRTGAPVFLMGYAAKPAWRLTNSWDRMMFAVPFGRGAVVWDGPLTIPPGADDAAMDRLAAEWSARLSAATRRAEALVGRPPD
jgi:lysophospholipid acyltransferase (LPLAT)-like uncharacterized protein